MKKYIIKLTTLIAITTQFVAIAGGPSAFNITWDPANLFVKAKNGKITTGTITVTSNRTNSNGNTVTPASFELSYSTNTISPLGFNMASFFHDDGNGAAIVTSIIGYSIDLSTNTFVGTVLGSIKLQNNDGGNYSGTLPFTIETKVNDEFITVWDMAITGSGINQLTFGVATAGTVSYTWETFPSKTLAGFGTFTGTNLSITGLPAGQKIRLKIDPNNFQRIIINNAVDGRRLIDIEQWGTTSWTSMADAFASCVNLAGSGASDAPNLSNVTDMSNVFYGTHLFNHPIGSWNVSNVRDMSNMFQGAYIFNQPIGNWNTSNVTSMSYMFAVAKAFNQPIQNWDVSQVGNMKSMFNCAHAFNQSISGWNVSNVVDMSEMFMQDYDFNQPIGNWNVSNVFSLSAMFHSANAFNQSIGGWNIGNVVDFSFMFYTATGFNQNLRSWGSKLNSDVDLLNFLDFSGMSTSNYDSLLNGFAASTVTGRTMDAAGLKFCTANVARANLTTTKNWTITGDGIGSAAAAIVNHPLVNATVCSGVAQIYSVSATGENLTYVWSNGTSGVNTIVSTAGIYFVTVTGTCGSPQVSSAARLSVTPLTQIVTHPLANVTVCSDVAQIYSVSATGENLTYVWSNGTSGVSTIVSTAGIYFVTVTGTCGTVLSTALSVSVNNCAPTDLITPLSSVKYQLFPNPNTGSFVIASEVGRNYTISSIDGKVLLSGTLSSNETSIETNLSKGIYFVTVGNRVGKLIVE